MDRETLVHRNRKMAQAFHSTPLKHHLRHVLLTATSYLPVRPQKTDQERILLIRPDHLGDVLLTIPAIRAIRAARPSAEIHALVGPWSADVLAEIPELDLILTLSFPAFKRGDDRFAPASPYVQLMRSAGQLREVGYSSAVIMRPDHWWGAMLAFFAGIRERIGYDIRDVAPFLTHTITLEHEHVVRQNLKLARHWTKARQPDEETWINFPVALEDQDYIEDYLTNRKIKRRTEFICIHPGSGTWVKLWQPEKWATAADTLAHQFKAKVVFTGGEHEQALVESITAHMETPAIILAGETRIGQLAALYKRARLVMGPDSGPLHLAAAVGTPTVTLFGPADPIEFGPWGPPNKHIAVSTPIGCRPCRVLNWADDKPEYHPCVRDISISQVITAAHKVAG